MYQEKKHTLSLYLIEILHQTTTARKFWAESSVLYLIEILHQTTTAAITWTIRLWLYLIEILHQTTTNEMSTLRAPTVVSY